MIRQHAVRKQNRECAFSSESASEAATSHCRSDLDSRMLVIICSHPSFPSSLSSPTLPHVQGRAAAACGAFVCSNWRLQDDQSGTWLSFAVTHIRKVTVNITITAQSTRMYVCVNVCVGVWSPTCLSVQHQEYTEMMRLCDEPCVRGMRCFVDFVFFFNSLFIYVWEGEALSHTHTEERQNFTRLYTPWSRPVIYVGVCKTSLT